LSLKGEERNCLSEEIYTLQRQYGKLLYIPHEKQGGMEAVE
jgi:hypothetical protein